MLLIVPVAHQLGIGGILWPVFHLCYCVKLMKWSQTCLGCCYIISLLKLHWYSFHFNRLGLRKPFSVELFGYQSGGCLKNEDLSLLIFFFILSLANSLENVACYFEIVSGFWIFSRIIFSSTVRDSLDITFIDSVYFYHYLICIKCSGFFLLNYTSN